MLVDSDEHDLDRLERALWRAGEVDVVAKVAGVEAGLAAIDSFKPDLVVTETELQDGSGFDLAVTASDPTSPLMAFVSASPRHAIRAIDVGAVGYLLKPIDAPKLGSLLDRAREAREIAVRVERVSDLERAVRRLREETVQDGSPAYLSELWVRERGTAHVRVPIESVDWIDAQDDYACIHAGDREHLLRTSLERLLQNLDPIDFARLHRSTIVRLDRVDHIRAIAPGRHEAVLNDGRRLPVGRQYAKRLGRRSRVI